MRLSFLLAKARLRLAEWFLPGRFFVQEKPFGVFYRGQYPDFDADVWTFNFRPDKLSRDANRWLTLRMLLDQVAACDGGEYAELGTYQGRTARVIFRWMAPGARLFCFDTFQGFAARDVAEEARHSRRPVVEGDYGNTDEQRVVRCIVDGGEAGRLVIRKGFFPETARGLEDVSWRFVHLDCDLAAPTRAGLDFFWRKLLPGGVILIHDYNGGFSEGIQSAFNEFAGETGCAAIPICDGGGSVALVKSR